VGEPYLLRVCDLRSDETMDILPIQGVGYDDYIGKTGSLSGTIPVPDAGMARRVRGCLLPGRTMLYLERGGQVTWGGPLWTRTPTRGARGYLTCPIQAGGLEGYYRSHRLLYDDLVQAGADQLSIARQLVTYAAAQSGGDLGIELGSETSGVLRDRTYSKYDLSSVGDLIDQLGAVDNGFEWRIQVYTDSTGVRHRALRLGYPKLTSGSTDLILSSPGQVLGYALPEDATGQANAWQARGASISTNLAADSVPLLSGLLTTPGDIAAGWPRLDGTSTYSTVTDQATLDAHATADLAASVRPIVIPSVTVRTSGTDQPALGSYVRLRIIDDWFEAPGLIARYRVVGLKVAPEERGRDETTDLYLEAA